METNFITAVESAGVVGAGGAGFPSHVKYKATAEYAIINGAECEPLLRVDQQLMTSQAEQLLEALDLIVREIDAKEGVIALKGKYHDAIDELNKHITSYPKLRLHLMDNFYPAGDEQVMVYEVTGKIVREGGIPLEVGSVVTNVETALNALSAYKTGQSVVEKYLTVTGEVANPITIKVPIGITVAQALELAGGATIKDFKIINGGPMMGKIIGLDDIITKTVKGLIVLPQDHSLINSIEKDMETMMREAKTSCLHCMQCTEVCPRYLLGHRLEPHKLIRIPSYGKFCDEKVTAMNAFLCCECRLCEYACIHSLQPWKVNSILKQSLSEKGIRNELKNIPDKVETFREYKRFPVPKLITRLGIGKYDVKAPYVELEKEFTQVNIPVRQSIGAPSDIIVKVGDTVQKGQLIAQIQEGKLGSNIHASISGTITSLDQGNITITK